MQILFLIPYPLGQAPSQRFRFEQYFDVLKKNNIAFDYQSFIDENTWKILYKKGHFFQKTIGILLGFFRRIKILFFLHKYHFIFIHREAAPLFPPVLEFIIAKIFRKKIIFDFDDAIWLPNTSEQNKISAFLKFHQKTGLICKWAWKVSAGNVYLCDYARQFNPHVVLNPTTIDTDWHAPTHNAIADKITIGWTGSHSTMKYLEEIVPIFQDLEKSYPIDFLVISNQNPELPLQNFKFIKWKKETEIEDLQQIEIGVMPLTDDAWAKGKCGFKALQYMSLCTPALVSPVGVNTQIIQHEVNGFLCQTPADWENALIKLINDENLRKKIGSKAQKTVEEKYSVRSNTNNFLSLFTDNQRET